jgi:4-hydroxybenzoate polyprenyltransferase
MKRIITYGRLIKFSHSIFALPFALSMAAVVYRTKPFSLITLALLIICIVAARTAAMSFNRILDRAFDKQNLRTADREIPSGAVSVAEGWVIVSVSSALFLISSALIGAHCLVLAPFVLALLFFYSWSKRCTSFCHLILGASLACAPGGVWYALTGTFDLKPLPLMFAVLFWVAGFDIIYACQDIEFDKENDLFSVPALLGIKNALWVSRIFHFMTILLCIVFGMVNNLGGAYLFGLVLFGLLLLRQHLLVNEHDLSRVDQAFFVANGWGSVLFFLGVLADTIL